MCVRTRTSYGCGHVYKQDQSCYCQSCRGLEKYHFENEGDCPQCKRDGPAVFRGREGKGRYAQGMYKREYKAPSVQTSPSISSHDSLSSPWMPSRRRERDWQKSPIRKQADEAWEEEHAQREEDLRNRYKSRCGSIGSAESHYASHEQQSGDDREASIREELRQIEDAKRIAVHRRRKRQASYGSSDSFDEAHRTYISGLHKHGHFSSGHRSHESGRSRRYDSGFGWSTRSAHDVYNTGSYFSDRIGDLVNDAQRWARWY